MIGPSDPRGGMVRFVMEAAHPHDVTTFADQYGLAFAAGIIATSR